MLTKQTVVNRIEIDEQGSVHVYHDVFILEDGVTIAGPLSRRTSYAPGDEVPAELTRAKAVADAVWTSEVTAAYQAVRLSKTSGR